jgi:uncharacterized protein (DUF1015 family)
MRRELHEALDAALESLDGAVGIVVLVEYFSVVEGHVARHELIVRASLTDRSKLSRDALDAVRKLAP